MVIQSVNYREYYQVFWKRNLVSLHEAFSNATSNSSCIDQFMVTYARKLTLNFMAPFYGRGLTASRLQPLRGGSLRFTIQFPELSGTHFIDLGRMKG